MKKIKKIPNFEGQKFQTLKFPLLLGISRKSFLSYENDSPDNRLGQTLALTSYLIHKGIDYIRVHDVFETRKMLTILNRVFKNTTE